MPAGVHWPSSGTGRNREKLSKAVFPIDLQHWSPLKRREFDCHEAKCFFNKVVAR